MTGIVLAGGENRRMGTDKAFLAFDGRPLIEHILAVFRGLFPRVIVVTNSPARYAGYAVDAVTDVGDRRGPLTGLYSGLQRSADEYNFVVACDMPFLNRGLIAYMAEAAAGYDIVVPRVNDFFEPLHAVYRKALLPVIESSLRRESPTIRGLFAQAKVRYITEEEIERFDPGRRSFRNLNTPEEYKEALCSDWECRS